MNGLDAYNGLSVKDKLFFNPKYLTGADLIRCDIKRIELRQRELKDKISHNLKGYRHGIIRNQFVKYYFWSSGVGMSMKDMSKTQYQAYCEFKKLKGFHIGSIDWLKDRISNYFLKVMVDFNKKQKINIANGGLL